MNIKNCFQLILFILLGCLVRANQGMYQQLHEGGFNRFDSTAANTYKKCKKQGLAVYTSNQNGRNNPKIKIRFRAASFINIEPALVPKLLEAKFSIIESLPLGSKTAHLLPFYYIFLFRLTPF